MDEHTHITRRNFLHAAPIAAATAIPLGLIGGAVVANDAASASGEHPWTRASRLARELATALAEVRDDRLSGGPAWMAIVRPADVEMAVAFADMASYDESWRELSRPKVSRAMLDAIRQHRIAMKAFLDSCPAADEFDPLYEGEAGQARWDKFCDEEQTALRKLLKLKPETIADVRAKTRYLRGKNIDLAGQRDGVALLLASLAN